MASAAGIGRLPSALAVALSYSAAEDQVFAQAEAGKLTAGDLFAAAVVAGGIGDAQQQQAYLARFQQLAEQLQRRVCAAGDAAAEIAAWAALVHAFLHREILTASYDLRCSRVSQAMDTGRYNCVSATILFNALAAEVGLETSGGESSAHVVSVVHTSGGPLHIETTCPHWRHVGESLHVAASLRDATASLRETRPREETRPRAGYRSVGAAQLVALVYYNVGVDLAEERRFAEAIAANYKALRLDPAHHNARANLLAAINNWALDLAQQGDFAQALAILAHGREFAPEHPTFALNEAALHERWAQSLAQPAPQTDAL